MKPAAGRLLLTAVLFLGWLCYLGYLVYSRPRTPDGQPLVLSRPQLLVSTLDVVARVEKPDKSVKIVKVLYPPKDPPVHEGDTITVDDLDRCRAPERESGQPPPPLDWSGPGEYLLPLQYWPADGKTRYRVTPIPPSPGYPRSAVPRIYAATPQALAQYREVRKPAP
jgi:hypothetical protein